MAAFPPDVDDHGVYRRYLDADDEEVLIDPAAIARLREAIGEPSADLEAAAPLVVRRGAPVGRGVVTVEAGGSLQVQETLPADLPTGYHRFAPVEGPERDLIVSPGRCHLPADLRAWGLAVQLYAARSRDSWGIGDLADLGTLRDLALSLNAGFLMVNPLHAPAPGVPQENSPYSPTTRRFASPLYLRPSLVPGGAALTPPAGMNAQRLLDRDAVWSAKLTRLREVFDARTGGDGFESWRAAAGPELQTWATWCALAERHGPSWRTWPSEYRHPSSSAVAAFAARTAEDVAFHAWLQWALAEQLTEFADRITVVQDLPIGFSPDGADAWAWQDLLATGFSVGAPPDLLNQNGQDWGLPPFVPWKLRAAGYRPFIQSMRATIAGAGGLRIDHVMGLFRLWWVPVGGKAPDGGYVQYPSTDLLDILALESERAAALVVGEDLGTVELGVPEALNAHNVLSYRLLLFEDDPPPLWPALSMAAISTHDLPTVAGLWTGSDRVVQQRYDVDSGAEAMDELVSKFGPVPADTDAGDATLLAHELLARAPSALRTVTLEDVVCESERPNLPGVTTRPENWRLALRVPVDELSSHEGVRRIAALMNAAGAETSEQGRYRVLAVGFGDRLRGTTSASLDAATPCPDWTVRDLVVHVVDTHWRVLARLPDVEPRAADPIADLEPQWEQARDAVVAALADPERAGTAVSVAGSEQPWAQMVATFLSSDLLLHTWDLARATGQDEHLDPDAVDAAHAFLTPMEEYLRVPGGFGPALDPPPDADAQTRLLALCGRAV